MAIYISVHLPQFIVLEDVFQTSSTKASFQVTFRDYKNFNDNAFKNDLNEVDWSLATNNTDVNLGFEIFLRLFNNVLDRHAPFKQAKKQQKKEKIKPWVTMKIRDKTYKQMIKAKTNQQKLIKHEIYKRYRNRIIDLLRISKQSYYQSFFEENKKNSKALWEGIHEIIYCKKNKKGSGLSSLLVDGQTITKPRDMAENFNEFFTSVGVNLQKKIPPTKRHFSDYLQNPNNESFFLFHTTPEEVYDIIKTLKSSKSVGPNSVPTKIIKW